MQRTKNGIIGSYVTIAVIIRKSINVPYTDENEAYYEALNQFTITDEDWTVDDLEVEEIEPEYLDEEEF